jgi:hypothetical protein
VAEILVWIGYALPMLIFVLRPSRTSAPPVVVPSASGDVAV